MQDLDLSALPPPSESHAIRRMRDALHDEKNPTSRENKPGDYFGCCPEKLGYGIRLQSIREERSVSK